MIYYTTFSIDLIYLNSLLFSVWGGGVCGYHILPNLIATIIYD